MAIWYQSPELGWVRTDGFKVTGSDETGFENLSEDLQLCRIQSDHTAQQGIVGGNIGQHVTEDTAVLGIVMVARIDGSVDEGKRAGSDMSDEAARRKGR